MTNVQPTQGYSVAAWTTFGTFKMNSAWSWRLPSLLQCAPALLQFVLSLFVPESPHWLVYKDRSEDALAMLTKYHAGGLNGSRDANAANSRLVRFELLEIQATLAEEMAQQAIEWKEFFADAGRPQAPVDFAVYWLCRADLRAGLNGLLPHQNTRQHRHHELGDSAPHQRHHVHLAVWLLGVFC